MLWTGQHCSSCSMPAAGRRAGAITLCSEDAGTLQDMPESCWHCYRSLPKCFPCTGRNLAEGEMRDVSEPCKLLAVSGALPLYTAEALQFLLSLLFPHVLLSCHVCECPKDFSAMPEVPCSLLPHYSRKTWKEGPKEGYEEEQRTGEPVLWGMTEGVMLFIPREEKAQCGPH